MSSFWKYIFVINLLYRHNLLKTNLYIFIIIRNLIQFCTNFWQKSRWNERWGKGSVQASCTTWTKATRSSATSTLPKASTFLKTSCPSRSGSEISPFRSFWQQKIFDSETFKPILQSNSSMDVGMRTQTFWEMKPICWREKSWRGFLPDLKIQISQKNMFKTWWEITARRSSPASSWIKVTSSFAGGSAWLTMSTPSWSRSCRSSENSIRIDRPHIWIGWKKILRRYLWPIRKCWNL